VTPGLLVSVNFSSAAPMLNILFEKKFTKTPRWRQVSLQSLIPNREVINILSTPRSSQMLLVGALSGHMSTGRVKDDIFKGEYHTNLPRILGLFQNKP
jgi:hypothetical protein